MSKFDATLRKVFYNTSTGFGSIAKTYKVAKALDDNVTLAATRDFLKRQELRQKAKPRTDNSYVAPGPRDTVQFDLADFSGFGPKSEYRYALIGTDVFTKLAFAQPLNGKTPDEAAAALENALKSYGLMKFAYTDMGSEFTNLFSGTLRRNLVRQIISRTPPAFVDRLIRTVKNGVRERQEALPGTVWWRLLDPVIEQYNSEKQTTTEAIPQGGCKTDLERRCWRGQRHPFKH